MIALLSLVKAIVSLCSIVFFFEKISFKNLAYRGIRDKASAKGILMQVFLSMLTNLWNCASKLGLARLNENGTLGLSSGFSLSTATFSLKSLILSPLIFVALVMVSSNLLPPKEMALTWALGLLRFDRGRLLVFERKRPLERFGSQAF